MILLWNIFFNIQVCNVWKSHTLCNNHGKNWLWSIDRVTRESVNKLILSDVMLYNIIAWPSLPIFADFWPNTVKTKVNVRSLISPKLKSTREVVCRGELGRRGCWVGLTFRNMIIKWDELKTWIQEWSLMTVSWCRSTVCGRAVPTAGALSFHFRTSVVSTSFRMFDVSISYNKQWRCRLLRHGSGRIYHWSDTRIGVHGYCTYNLRLQSTVIVAAIKLMSCGKFCGPFCVTGVSVSVGGVSGQQSTQPRRHWWETPRFQLSVFKIAKHRRSAISSRISISHSTSRDKVFKDFPIASNG